MQVNFNALGKTWLGQGYREPNGTANISYKHSITSRLNFVLNVTDIFVFNKFDAVTDTQLLKQTSIRRSEGRLLYAGLSYRIGGLARRAAPR